MAGPDDEEQKKQPSPPPVEFVKPGEAPAPLPPRDQPPAAWVTRPEDYLRQVAPPPQLRAPGQIHRVAGILLVLSAFVAVGWTIALSIRFLTPAQYENATAGLTPEAWAIGQICGLLGIWGQAIALLAGVMSFRRMSWRFVFAASLISVLSIGATAVAFFDPFFGGAAGLGLVGVILLSLGRREFPP